MPICLIYGLVSSDNPSEIRYVGKTTLEASKRLALHISAASKEPRTALHRWIVSHHSRGHGVSIVPVMAEANWDGDEERIIAEYRAAGARLLNILPGGQGTLGYRHTEHERRKRSERMSGRSPSTEARAKIAAALKGRERPSEAREKQRATVLGARNHFHGKTHTASSKEANGRARAKLTDEQAMAVRAARSLGETQQSIADRVGISQAQVSAIVRGKAYRWLPL